MSHELNNIAYSLHDYRTTEITIEMMGVNIGAVTSIVLAKVPKSFRIASDTVFQDFNIEAQIQMPHKESPSHFVSPYAVVSAVITTAYNLTTQTLKVIAISSKELGLQHRNDILNARSAIKPKKIIFKALRDLDIVDYPKAALKVKTGEFFEVPKDVQKTSSAWREVKYPPLTIAPICLVWGLEKFGVIESIKEHITASISKYNSTGNADYFDELVDLLAIKPDTLSDAYLICSDEEKRVDRHDCKFSMNKAVNTARTNIEEYYTTPSALGSPFNAIHASSLAHAKENQTESFILNTAIGYNIPVDQEYIDYAFNVVASITFPLNIVLNNKGDFDDFFFIDPKKAVKKIDMQSPEIRLFTRTKQEDFTISSRKYTYQENQNFDFSFQDAPYQINGIQLEVVPLTENTKQAFRGNPLAIWNKEIEETFNIYGIMGAQNDGFYPLNPYAMFSMNKGRNRDITLENIKMNVLGKLPCLKTDLHNTLFYVQEAFCTADKAIGRM